MIRAMPFDVPEAKLKRKPKALIPTGKAADWLEEVRALTEHEPALYMVLVLMIGLGLRGGEARNARWEWLDLEREIYTPGAHEGRRLGRDQSRPGCWRSWRNAELHPGGWRRPWLASQ